jgi:serine protease Do
MRKLMWALTLTILSVTVGNSYGADTEKSATPTKEVTTSHRNTPVTAVVDKTRDSIVSIKVIKNGKEVIGTGVVIDERGYIVTNRHVVNGADKIAVKMWDKTTEYVAKIEVSDASYDVAVIKINSEKKFKALRLGPSSDIKDGEPVIAIGSPYGFANTITKGEAAGGSTEITMPDGTVLKKLIQHSAQIDPGNSGGPLFNYDGELIGINVALHDKARCIGFALNADEVQKVLTKHMSAMKLTGLNHGLTCKVEVKEAVAERQKVFILDVEEQTPAAEAGLKYGDQLVKVGSYNVCRNS